MTDFRGRSLTTVYPTVSRVLRENMDKLPPTLWTAHSCEKITSTIEFMLRIGFYDCNYADELRKAFFLEIIELGSAKWPDLEWKLIEDNDLIALTVEHK